MKLTGQNVQQICDALVDAYPTRDLLRMLVRIELDQNLEEIAGGENQSVAVFNLVAWAERNGRVEDLVMRAQARTPGNVALKQLAAEWREQTLPGAAEGFVSPLAGAAAPPGPTAIDVFLSYSRRDSTAMHEVQEALREAGLAVWTDEGLAPGTQSWKDAIAEAVRQAGAMVVLLSPNAAQSEWVQNEIGFAQVLNKRILPVLLAGEVAAAVPIDLINVQRVDARRNLDLAVERELLPQLRRQFAPARTQPAARRSGEELAAVATSAAPGAQPHQRERAGGLRQGRTMVLWLLAAVLAGALGSYVLDWIGRPAQLPADADAAETVRATDVPAVAVLPTVSPTAMATETAALMATATLRPVATATPTAAVTATPKPISTAAPTATAAPMATATATRTATATPEPTSTATPTAAPTATATATRTATATPKPTSTATRRPTATATRAPTATRTPTPTAPEEPAVAAAVLPTPTPGAFRTNIRTGATYIYVPAGPFTIGSEASDKDAADREKPQTTIYLAAFWIMRTEVTNKQYGRCVEEGACTEPDNERWNDPAYAEHPVVEVSWQQANEYAAWAGGRLPTEAQWEKACRGTQGQIWPWGNNAPTEDLANFERKVGDTTAVGDYSPQGDSPYGLVDMAGNVREWTNSQDSPYPYDAADGREQSAEIGVRTVRGGMWDDMGFMVRCAYRGLRDQAFGSNDIGFRVVTP